MEVIRDAYTLSKCDGLVCMKSMVAENAQMMKYSEDSEYEDLVIIDKGMAHNSWLVNQIKHRRIRKEWAANMKGDHR